MPIIEITQYTDPYCTWCWGSEPILRKIEESFGDQVRFRFVMGGLVKDISQFSDPANGISGQNWYLQVAAHWLEASERHGMPVDQLIWYELKSDFTSTYPASIAYKAAQFQSEEKANVYLRLMREGAACGRKKIHRLEVQAQLAGKAGLNAQQLIDDILGGDAEDAFFVDINECIVKGITGFPTFSIRSVHEDQAIDRHEVMIPGFQQFGHLVSVMQEVSDEKLKVEVPEFTEEAILTLINKYQRIAPKEIAEILNAEISAVIEKAEELANKGSIGLENVGNGHLYSAIDKASTTN